MNAKALWRNWVQGLRVWGFTDLGSRIILFETRKCMMHQRYKPEPFQLSLDVYGVGWSKDGVRSYGVARRFKVRAVSSSFIPHKILFKAVCAPRLS